VVIGDRTAGAKNEIFERIINEVKILAPDFVLNTGDLIEGYTDDLKSVESEWDYIIRQMNRTAVPYYLTPGNHDQWSGQGESIYVQHFGKTYYSFDYEKCHFVIIDNSRYDSIAQIPKAQMSWLTQDLAKHKKAPLTFCLMHKPFWNYSNQAATIHKIFQAGGVDYVFSGHDHHYMSKVWDSITYIQLGPSGSRYKDYNSEEQGAFQNYLLVNIKNNQASIAVIKPGNLLPDDIVTTEAVATIDRIENEAVQISQITIQETQTIRDTIGLNIKNVTNFSLNTTLKWSFDQTAWQIIPESISCSLPAGSNGYYKFNFNLTKSGNIYPLPELTFSYPYFTPKEHRVRKLLPVQRIATCRKATRPPIIDGILNDADWATAQPLTTFGTSDGYLSPIEKTSVYFIYDDKNLYIGAKCSESQIAKLQAFVTGYDAAVYKDDHLNFILQPNLDSITYYQIFINPIGTISDRRCSNDPKTGKSIKDPTWNLFTQIKTNRDQENWSIELAIPLAQFPDYSTSNWGFNIVRFQFRLDKIGVYQVPFVHDPKTFAGLKFIR
jgi:UDP-2,3-diacylglucosamine pyrophosphatase LpxH